MELRRSLPSLTVDAGEDRNGKLGVAILDEEPRAAAEAEPERAACSSASSTDAIPDAASAAFASSASCRVV